MNKHSSSSAVEGFISFHGHQVWYRIVKPNQEAEGKLPLLCIHGGPGVPHDYLEPLEAIANTGRRVIFYDQLGCGNSDRPTWDTTVSALVLHRFVIDLLTYLVYCAY
jgi:pimeloyl-ACP methyl ester carboxylesterase